MQRRSDKNLAYRNVADPKIEVDLCEQCIDERTDNSARSEYWNEKPIYESHASDMWKNPVKAGLKKSCGSSLRARLVR